MSLLSVGFSCSQTETYAPYKEKTDEIFEIKKRSDVVINEVGTYANGAWVELYNTSSKKILIKDWTFWNSLGANKTYSVSEQISIEAHDFAVVQLPVEFKKCLYGDKLLLTDQCHLVADQIDIPILPDDAISYGRYPDFTGDFLSFWESSKGKKNEDALKYCPRPDRDDVCVNELDYGGGSISIEFYNKTVDDKNLGGLFLKNNNGDTYIIPERTVVQASNYFVLKLSENFIFDNNDVLSFGLANTFEDKVTLPPLPESLSYGRKTDGGDFFVKFTQKTMGGSNNGSEEFVVIPKLKINELFINTSSQEPQFIELLNISEEAINLNDYIISCSAWEKDFTIDEDIILNPNEVAAVDMLPIIPLSDVSITIANNYYDLQDNISVTSLYPDVSYGSYNDDRDSDWVWYIGKGTKGKKNTGSPLFFCINEVSLNLNGSFKYKYAEFYNPNPVTIDLKNYWITASPKDGFNIPVSILDPILAIDGYGIKSDFGAKSHIIVNANVKQKFIFGASHCDVYVYYSPDLTSDISTNDKTFIESISIPVDFQFTRFNGKNISDGRFPDGEIWLSDRMVSTPGIENNK